MSILSTTCLAAFNATLCKHNAVNGDRFFINYHPNCRDGMLAVLDKSDNSAFYISAGYDFVTIARTRDGDVHQDEVVIGNWFAEHVLHVSGSAIEICNNNMHNPLTFAPNMTAKQLMLFLYQIYDLDVGYLMDIYLNTAIDEEEIAVHNSLS